MSDIIMVEIDWVDPFSNEENPLYEFDNFEEAVNFIRLTIDNGYRCITYYKREEVKEEQK